MRISLFMPYVMRRNIEISPKTVATTVHCLTYNLINERATKSKLCVTDENILRIGIGELLSRMGNSVSELNAYLAKIMKYLRRWTISEYIIPILTNLDKRNVLLTWRIDDPRVYACGVRRGSDLNSVHPTSSIPALPNSKRRQARTRACFLSKRRPSLLSQWVVTIGNTQNLKYILVASAG